jgi:hypothetical protein
MAGTGLSICKAVGHRMGGGIAISEGLQSMYRLSSLWCEWVTVARQSCYEATIAWYSKGNERNIFTKMY